MAQDLIRLMQALFLPAAQGCRDAPWSPPADVYQTRQGYLVKLDLAGVRPEDVQLALSGNRMTVRGVRRDFTTEEGCSYYRMEIAYNRFERTLELPCRLEHARVSTDYRDGMLLVYVRPEPER
jgi:HSP20 family protein